MIRDEANSVGDDSEIVNELIGKLSKAGSTTEVLRSLEPVMRAHHIIRMRYYRFSRSKDSIYSVECIGHNRDITDYLRFGQFEKRKDDHPLDKSETFWAFELERPVGFLWDSKVELPLRLRTPGAGIPVILVPEPNNVELINQEKDGAWVDIPLYVGKWPSGKLSCDIKLETNNEFELADFRRSMERFFRIAQVTAPYLEFWRAQNVSAPMNTASVEFRKCESLENVLNYCLTEFRKPHFLNCQNIDVLLRQTDSLGSDRLVLKRTSFEPLSQQEDTAHYILPDSSITGWVATRQRTIRVYELLDVDERDRQLKKYDGNIKWAQQIPLSRKHACLMVTPIVDDDGQTVGVLRFADKIATSRGEGFSSRDQRLAELLATHCLGPAIKNVRHEQYIQALPGRLNAINELSVKDVAISSASLFENLADVFKEIISQNLRKGARRKKFLISRLNERGDGFDLLGAGDSELEIPIDNQKSHSLAGTLTGYVIQNHDPILVTDLESAVERKLYKPIADGARSVLACRIAHKDKIFGSIAIISSHFDLDIESHGEILRVLCGEVSEMMARRLAANVNAAYSGLRHDTGKIIAAVHRLRLVAEVDPLLLEATLDTLNEVIDAHCRSGPLPPSRFRRCCHRIDVPKLFESVRAVVELIDEEPAETIATWQPENLSVIAFQPFLRVCMLNLLRNCREHSTGQILVSGGIESHYLTIRFRNERRDDLGGLRRAMEIDADTLLDTPEDELNPKQRGLINVRRLARWHQIDDHRIGRLEVDESDDDRVEIILRIPCD